MAHYCEIIIYLNGVKISNVQNITCSCVIPKFQIHLFWILCLVHLNLFRISCFGFRVFLSYSITIHLSNVHHLDYSKLLMFITLNRLFYAVLLLPKL